MGIGEAVAAMRAGNKVTRPGWKAGRWIGLLGDTIEWGEGGAWKGIEFMCGSGVLLARDFRAAGPVPGRKTTAPASAKPAAPEVGQAQLF